VTKTQFALGHATPLPIPASLEREWAVNGVQGAELAQLREEHLGTVGYPYPWGQIVENRCDEAAPGDPIDPAAPVLTWGFVLSALHDEFLDAGGNLGELADLAVTLLDAIASAAQAEDRTDVIPAFIGFEEGEGCSAFQIVVSGHNNVDAARDWVDQFFIDGVLPLLIERFRAENASAAEAPVAFR
jgi:hypothetical protein